MSDNFYDMLESFSFLLYPGTLVVILKVLVIDQEHYQLAFVYWLIGVVVLCCIALKKLGNKEISRKRETVLLAGALILAVFWLPAVLYTISNRQIKKTAPRRAYFPDMKD